MAAALAGIQDATAPAKGREGRDGAARGDEGGGVPEMATRREAEVFDLRSAAGWPAGGSALRAWCPADSPLTRASPQTPLCFCPRPGGATAGGAELPHWLSRGLYRLAPKRSSGILLSLLPLVAGAASQAIERGDCPATRSPWKQFRETPRAAGIASLSMTGGGGGARAISSRFQSASR